MKGNIQTSERDATFRLPAGDRIVGLVEYLIVGPVIAVMLLLAIGGIGEALVQLAGWPAVPVAVVAGMLSLSAMAWLIRFAVVDYRRRAGVTLTLGNQGLTEIRGGRTVSIRFEDVERIRLVPHGGDVQCVLIFSNGKSFWLPVDVAPLSVIRTQLDEKVVGRLAASFAESLANGDSVVVSEDRFSATSRVVAGSVEILLGLLKMLTILGIPHGLAALALGMLKIRSGRRGRNGNYEVNCKGLVQLGMTGDSDIRPWSQLCAIRVDDAGMALIFAGGQEFAVSLFSENYLPFANWISHLCVARSNATHNASTHK